MSCNTATRCLKSRASPCDANCGRRHTPSRTRRSAARSTASRPDTGSPSAGRLRTLTPTTWADTPGATRVLTAMVALPILKATGAPRCPVAATLARREGGAPTTLGGGTVRTGARTGTVALMLDAGTRTRHPENDCPPGRYRSCRWWSGRGLERNIVYSTWRCAPNPQLTSDDHDG